MRWRSFVLQNAVSPLYSCLSKRHLEAALVREQACTTKTVQVESLAADSHLGFGCGEFAAAETIRPPSTNAARTSYLPTDFTTLPFSERTAQTLEWAELSINRWQVNTGQPLFPLPDGGDLLCCELCSNVDHAACYRPPLVQIPDYYVCGPA
jgi:hypothetical protein